MALFCCPTSKIISNILVCGGSDKISPVTSFETYSINDDHWNIHQIKLPSALVKIRCFAGNSRSVLIFGQHYTQGHLESVVFDTETYTFKNIQGMSRRLPFAQYYLCNSSLYTFGGEERRVQKLPLNQKKVVPLSVTHLSSDAERYATCFQENYCFETVVFGRQYGPASAEKLHKYEFEPPYY